MPTPHIDIQNLTFGFNGRRILTDITLAIDAGEYLTIIGPNGAGKTTLLKCLNRILRGGTGCISIAGRPLSTYRQRELATLMAYVPQADGRGVPFTVSEFVMMGRYPYLSPFSSVGDEDRQAVQRALSLTGAEPFVDRLLATLSGGERQKVFIAAALAQEAAILLVDEPTTFLDHRHQAEVQRTLREINQGLGVTIVAVTHDINSFALWSDRVVALKDGRVSFCGVPAELMRSEVLEAIYDAPFELATHPRTGQPVVVPEAAE